MTQSVLSWPADGWVVGSELGVIWDFFSYNTQQWRATLCGYTKFDSIVDEGKGLLNSSRDKNYRQAPQKEGRDIKQIK